MTPIVVVEAPIAPQPKERPRFTRSKKLFAKPWTYTGKKTSRFEEQVGYYANLAMRGMAPLYGIPLHVKVICTFAHPSPTGPWLAHLTKPDAENLSKSAVDACNGIVWQDDCTIVHLESIKRYGKGASVRIEVYDNIRGM